MRTIHQPLAVVLTATPDVLLAIAGASGAVILAALVLGALRSRRASGAP